VYLKERELAGLFTKSFSCYQRLSLCPHQKG